MITNDLPNLSEHILNLLLTEEDIAEHTRLEINRELIKRSMERDTGQEMILLTSQILHDASSSGYHGFTTAQKAVFGFKRNAEKGWLRSLVGKTVPISQYKKFVEAAKIRKRKEK